MIRSVALSVAILAAGCASSGRKDFTVRLGDRTLSFNCEVQKLHPNSKAVVKKLPPKQGPADRTLGLEPGQETIAWLYHFEDDGSELKDEECAYSMAIGFKKPASGRIAFPSNDVSFIFFCDNWGRGFRSVEARATKGWLEIGGWADRCVSGEFQVTTQGNRERAKGTWEPATIELEGKFSATR